MRTLYGRKLTLSERWCRAILALAVAVLVGASGALAGSDLLPAATALPCPDGSQTCGPQPTQDPGPTQGNQVPTTAPQAPQTTIPPNTDTGAPSPPTNGSPGFQGTVQAMPTPDNPSGCIVNCEPTQPALTTGQSPPTTGGQATVTNSTPTTTIDQTTTTENQRCEVAGKSSLKVQSTTALQGELAAAIQDWNSSGAASIASGGGGSPDVVVSDTYEPGNPHRGVYYPSVNGGPAQIVINRAKLDGASPDVIRALMAHELGHALGLPDAAGGSSLMATLGNGSVPKAEDLAALALARQRCATSSGPQYDPFCHDPNNCNMDLPMEALMEACETGGFMRDDEFVGAWGGKYFLRCGEYFHITRDHFQSKITPRDRTDFRGCVGLTLALGSDYVEANERGLRWTNPQTGVTAKIPLGTDPKYGNTIIKSAYAGGDSKDWGGCVRGTVAENGGH